MPYSSSIEHDVACFTLEGNLNALDLLMMFKSPEYKSAIHNYKKILIDYTQITGISLTKEDVISITLIGKSDLEHASATHIVAALLDNERQILQQISEKLFIDSDLQLEVADSKAKALNLLKQYNT
ncbi:hypothetical protein [Paraglaciecola aestuariivivens]